MTPDEKDMTPDDKVTEASIQSFPASDPPAWIAGSASEEQPEAPIDLNRADADELTSVLGIAHDEAERIVRHRDARTDRQFHDASEILQVEGIDPAVATRVARRVAIY